MDPAHCCSTMHGRASSSKDTTNGEQQYVSDGGTLVSKDEPAGTFRNNAWYRDFT